MTQKYLAIPRSAFGGSYEDNYMIIPVTRASRRDSGLLLDDFFKLVKNSHAQRVTLGLPPEDLGRKEMVGALTKVSSQQLKQMQQTADTNIEIVETPDALTARYRALLPAAPEVKRPESDRSKS